MRFERDFVQQVESGTDLISLIQERGVVLKKAGSNYKGCCPFHSEKTPSFNVNPRKNFYHCFGCGVGGGPLKFLMEHDRLGFVEAVTELAQRAGIALPEMPSGGRYKDSGDPGLAALAQANEFYREQLRDSTTGLTARRYLAERMVPEALWDAFSLGFAPDDWRLLKRTLERRKVPEAVMIEAGLIKPSERSGQTYDRFRNRLIFPIRDTRGRVIGFGGRMLKGDEGPKYLNSPESEYYHKSQVLYGLHEGLSTIREQREMIFVEGYLDVIRLHEYGFCNAVAPCGTALTEEHVKLVERYAEKALLVFDGDDAGRNAALKSCPLFLGKRVQVRILTMPPGEDPDTLLLNGGAAAFGAVRQSGKGLLEFWVEQTLARFPDTPEGRVQALEELLPSLQEVEDGPLQQLLLQSIGERLRLRSETVLEAFNRLKKSNSFDINASLPEEVLLRDECWVLQAMLSAPRLIAQARLQLQADDFQDSRWRRFFVFLTQIPDDQLADWTPNSLESSHPEFYAEALELLATEALETHVAEQFALSLGRLKERTVARHQNRMAPSADWEQFLQHGIMLRQERQNFRHYRSEPPTSTS